MLRLKALNSMFLHQFHNFNANLKFFSLNRISHIRFFSFCSHTHLSGDDGYFRDGGLCKGIQQFGSMSDDAAILLSGTCWQQHTRCECALSDVTAATIQCKENVCLHVNSFCFYIMCIGHNSQVVKCLWVSWLGYLADSHTIPSNNENHQSISSADWDVNYSLVNSWITPCI